MLTLLQQGKTSDVFTDMVRHNHSGSLLVSPVDTRGTATQSSTKLSAGIGKPRASIGKAGAVTEHMDYW